MHVTWGIATKVVDGEAGNMDFYAQWAPPVGISSHLSAWKACMLMLLAKSSLYIDLICCHISGILL